MYEAKCSGCPPSVIFGGLTPLMVGLQIAAKRRYAFAGAGAFAVMVPPVVARVGKCVIVKGTAGVIVKPDQCHVAGTPAPSFVGLYEWWPNCTTPRDHASAGIARSKKTTGEPVADASRSKRTLPGVRVSRNGCRTAA